jgi:hypothetical protein
MKLFHTRMEFPHARMEELLARMEFLRTIKLSTSGDTTEVIGIILY